MLSDYLTLAVKNLRRRGLRSWLTLIGILIGITAVVSLISLGDGLKLAVNSQFGISTTNVITIQGGGLTGYGPPGTGVVTPLTKSDVKEIDSIDLVEIAIARNIETVQFEFKDRVQLGFIGSLPDGEGRKLVYDTMEVTAEQGRLLRDGDSRKIVIGSSLADKNKNNLDIPIELGDSLLINEVSFRVVGIMEKKGSFILDSVILMNDADVEDITNVGETVDIIVAKIKTKEDMPLAKEKIEELLRKIRNVKEGEEDFEVSTPEAQLATVNQILAGVQIFIVLIASVSIIVGGVGIVNTMTTSVLERVKEIGIMKSVGARNSDIFLMFFIEAGLLGLLGGIGGVIVGTSIGYLGTMGLNSFLGSTTSPEINLPVILLALAGSFIVGSIAGISPAMNAARQHPVEALRK